MSPCREFVGTRWSSSAPANSRMCSDRVGLSSVGYVAPGLPHSLSRSAQIDGDTQVLPVCATAVRVASVNTTQLRGGAQTLTLLVTNAPGNTTSVQSPPVVVDNDGPPAPTSLTATAVGNGSDAIDLSWSNPANPPQAVSGAFAQRCQTSCGAAVGVNGTGGADHRSGSGYLHDSALVCGPGRPRQRRQRGDHRSHSAAQTHATSRHTRRRSRR